MTSCCARPSHPTLSPPCAGRLPALWPRPAPAGGPPPAALQRPGAAAHGRRAGAVGRGCALPPSPAALGGWELCRGEGVPMGGSAAIAAKAAAVWPTFRPPCAPHIAGPQRAPPPSRSSSQCWASAPAPCPWVRAAAAGVGGAKLSSWDASPARTTCTQPALPVPHVPPRLVLSVSPDCCPFTLHPRRARRADAGHAAPAAHRAAAHPAAVPG